MEMLRAEGADDDIFNETIAHCNEFMVCPTSRLMPAYIPWTGCAFRIETESGLIPIPFTYLFCPPKWFLWSAHLVLYGFFTIGLER